MVVREIFSHKCFWLVAIFVLALAARLFIAFETDNFALGGSYFTLRQVGTISSSGLPSFEDPLSFSGRTHIFPPLYYYVVSAFSVLFGPVIALKVLPNIFASLLVIIVYFIVLEITKSRRASLLSALAAAFIPVFFAGTVVSASTVSFSLPLIFYCIYCFMRLGERVFMYQFLLFSFLLSLTSAVSFLLVIGLLLYLLFFTLEFRKRSPVETECIFFVTFLTLWVNILIYKKAFLFHSYELIWRNLPPQILDNYFRQIDVLSSVTGVGLLTLVLGVFAVYRYMFNERDKRTYLLMAFALSVGLLLWFKLITLEVGLMFLGAILVPLFGQAANAFFRYVDKTRVARFSGVFFALFALVLFLTSVVPSVARASVSVESAVWDDEVGALEWLRVNSPADAVVLSTIQEGNLVSAVSLRKNVADEDFVLVRHSGEVFEDVKTMYTSFFLSDAVELMTKYGVDYVYLSPRAKSEFGISSLKYMDPKCFRLVYGEDSDVKVYKVLCRAGA